MIEVGLLLVSLFYWPSTFQTKNQNSFNKIWAKVPMTLFARIFSSVYRRSDPMGEIRAGNSVLKVSQENEII